MMKIKYKTPYKDLLPPLSTAEFDALKASVKAEGVRDAIVLDELGNVLDGYHRLKCAPNAPTRVIKGLSEGEKQAFVYRSNFARRNLSTNQKKDKLATMKKIAFDLRTEDARKNTQKRVAALLGVGRVTVQNWFASEDNEPNVGPNIRFAPDARVKIPPLEHRVITERVEAKESPAQVAADYGVTPQHVNRIVTKETKAKTAKVERKAKVAKLGKNTLNIHHGDFRKIGNLVEDNSVDMIFTDPPYDKDAVSLYGDLSEFAARVLRPGGWCLAYSGHKHLPEAITQLADSLTYGWTFAISHSGGDARFRTFKLHVKWKPIFGYYKPPLDVWWDWFPDLTSGGKEKTDHPWQQAVAEAEHFIDALTPANGVVCDPFCGSGTTCLAARTLGCQWVAFDIDKEAVETARSRLA